MHRDRSSPLVPAALAIALIAALGPACRDDRVTLAKAGSGDAGAAPDGNDAAPANWIDRTPCVVPAAVPVYRTSAMVTYDSDRHQLIVYGGQSSLGNAQTDIWDIDVTTGVWAQRTPCGGAQPPSTDWGVLVYDHQRHRAVMFSGYAGQAWDWDPTDGAWTPRPASGPAPVGEPAAASYDDTRGKVLVFTDPFPMSGPTVLPGESLWEWDGASGTWLVRIDGALPWVGRSGRPAMAFDPHDDALWLFADNSSDRLTRLDVATGTWTDLTPAVRPALWPAGRGYASLATDRTRGRVVLFGGARASDQRDLWELDPSTVTWKNRTPANVPITGTVLPDGVVWPPAAPETGAFEATNQIVRLGGFPQLAGAPALWAWDGAAGRWSTRVATMAAPRWPNGTEPLMSAYDGEHDLTFAYAPEARLLWQWTAATNRWERLTPEGIAPYYPFPDAVDAVPWPSARLSSAIAYDPTAQRLVLFGGEDYVANNGLHDDLWLWDPATRQLTSVPRPSASAPWPAPRGQHALAYDPVRKRVLLFGGAVPEASDELWALDTNAATWERIPASGVWPAARLRHTFVLDGDRNVLVLQGGLSTELVGAVDVTDGFTDTWELPAGSSAWRKPPASALPLRWPSVAAPPPLAFVRGTGMLALAPVGKFASALALWRWRPDTGAWVPAGIDVPRPISLANGFPQQMAGGGDALMLLLTGSMSRPEQEQDYAETWQWQPPR